MENKNNKKVIRNMRDSDAKPLKKVLFELLL